MLGIGHDVIGIIAKELKVNSRKIQPETLLNELGDSLDLIRIVLALEENFNLEIIDENIEAFSSVGDVITYISRCKEEKNM